MSVQEQNFGPEYRSPAGFICKPTDSESPHHFGGTAWKIRADDSIPDSPSLIVVLDLSDPRLGDMGAMKSSQLPLCSCLNSSAWYGTQDYRIDVSRKEVILESLTVDTVEASPQDCRLPNPLPEKCLELRDMLPNEYPSTEKLYWDNCDAFLGGSSAMRLMGPPLWMQNPIEHKCDCDSNMLPVFSMGSENPKGPFEFIDGEPLFIGEAALYFFLCAGCMKLRVQSQST